MDKNNTQTANQELTKKDFVSDQDVRWCPGCGDYAILAQVQKTFPKLEIPKEKALYPFCRKYPAISSPSFTH